jgi:hypothetical protein
MDEDGDPADTMRERAGRSTVVAYLLVDADRRAVTAGLAVALFLALLGAGALVPGAGETLRSGDPLETLFQALVGATVTGVTLVLTLNQVVLSQELGAAGDQRERMEGALAFREEVAALLDEPAAPAEPSAFLRALLEATADRARALEADRPEGLADDDLDRLVSSVTADADRAVGRLEGASFGTFGVLSAVLDFNYSRKLYEARRLEARENSEPLAELSEALELFGPAREHFKTLYVQSELIALSRAVSATALPALVVAVAVLGLVDPAAVGVRAGVDLLVVTMAGGVTAVLAPFLVLLAYVVRIATVTGRTLSIGPFLLRETDRSTDA